MARTRLRKRDRVAQAGKGCNSAQWGFGTVKRKDKEFATHSTVSPEAIQRWAATHAQKER